MGVVADGLRPIDCAESVMAGPPRRDFVMMPQRNLTEADVDAILNAFEKRFYTNLGKGVWELAWKAIVIVIAAIAGYKLWRL